MHYEMRSPLRRAFKRGGYFELTALKGPILTRLKRRLIMTYKSFTGEIS